MNAAARASGPQASMPSASSPYASFWMAGFEGADHVNAHAEPLDLVRATGHLDLLEDDYRRVAALGLRTIRESIGWRLTEVGPGGAGRARFDFDRPLRFADAANRHGLQIMWTLMHYGFPPGADLFSDDFDERFADFAGAAARALKPLSDRPPVFTPINEISFLAWAIAGSNFIHPYAHESSRRQRAGEPPRDVGWEAKWRLIRASLRAMKAISAEDPRARFLHVEPLTHIVPPPQAPHLAARADEIGRYQWQAWDMLSGDLMPELGGTPAALDLLGVNYYHNCQWEMDTGQRLEWHLSDPRRVSMSSLLRKVAKRFDKPIVIAETSHVGSGRALWMQDVGREIGRAMTLGVDIQGVCLYPVVDRPDWNDLAHWHNSGLFDNRPAGAPAAIERHHHLGYTKSLLRAQRELASTAVARHPEPHLLVVSDERWQDASRSSPHLLQLARRHPVVFVEAAVAGEATYLERLTPCAGVEVLRPHARVDAATASIATEAAVAALLETYLAENLIDDYLVWYRTNTDRPMRLTPAPRAVFEPGLVADVSRAEDGAGRVVPLGLVRHLPGSDPGREPHLAEPAEQQSRAA